jgi:cell division cycle 14
MDILSIATFISLLDHELSSFPSCKIVFCVDKGRRALTNAAFILGAYMILKLELGVGEVARRFGWLRTSSMEAFRDASFATPDFGLTLQDCWRGLERGRDIGWVRVPSAGGRWGMIDLEQHAHYGDGLNGDAHVVVPGKLVAFRGPQDLACGDFSDAGGLREFSAGHYARLLGDLGVTDVVRLNEAEYERGGFVSRGIAHHDLPFDDCSAPPDCVVAAFFAAADAAEGAVAVHCKAGLGRTGTLIALYLMRSHGFGAREAMGWLRIMRPGSVIGEQQHYLCAVERRAAEARAAAGAGWAAAQAGAVPRGFRSAFVPAAGLRRSKPELR